MWCTVINQKDVEIIILDSNLYVLFSRKNFNTRMWKLRFKWGIYTHHGWRVSQHDVKGSGKRKGRRRGRRNNQWSQECNPITPNQISRQ